MQFRIAHLFFLVAWLATAFALFRIEPLIAIACCPLCFGAVAGGITAGRKSGAIFGFFSSLYWTIVATFFAGVLITLLMMVDGFPAIVLDFANAEHRELFLTTIAYLFVATVSSVGGYIGGRVVADDTPIHF